MNHLPMPIMSSDDKYRFWSYVFKKEDDKCWKWLGGYFGGEKLEWQKPNFHVKNKGYVASRIAYYLSTGIDPIDYLVCHTCDNPSCCNPKHLFLGTDKDNTLDSVNKNRWSINRFGSKTFSSDTIKEIRQKYRSGQYTWRELAKEYKAGKTTIGRIINYLESYK